MLPSTPIHWSELNSQGQPRFKGRGLHKPKNTDRYDSEGAHLCTHGHVYQSGKARLCCSNKLPQNLSASKHKIYLLLVLLVWCGSGRGSVPCSHSFHGSTISTWCLRVYYGRGEQNGRELPRQGNALAQKWHGSLPLSWHHPTQLQGIGTCNPPLYLEENRGRYCWTLGVCPPWCCTHGWFLLDISGGCYN